MLLCICFPFLWNKDNDCIYYKSVTQSNDQMRRNYLMTQCEITSVACKFQESHWPGPDTTGIKVIDGDVGSLVPPSPASGFSCPLSVVRADRGMCLERGLQPRHARLHCAAAHCQHWSPLLSCQYRSLVWVKVKGKASNEGWSAKISQSQRRPLGKKSEGKGVPDDQMFRAPVSSGGVAPPCTLSLVTWVMIMFYPPPPPSPPVSPCLPPHVTQCQADHCSLFILLWHCEV